MSIWRKFCKLCLKLGGWEILGTEAPEPKCLLLGAPHTSIWDFVVAYMYYQSVGGDALCMVKEDFFKIPILGGIVRWMGGIPVSGTNPSAVCLSAIREMEKREKFHLSIAVEGTRKPVKRWKAGFHLIATTANIPVYLCIFDWGSKRVGIVEPFEITDDAKADLARLQARYEELGLVGKHPEKYITH